VLGIGVVQTAVTVLVLVAIAATRRPGGPPAGRAGLAVASLGLLDVTANLLFATASSTANHAAVAVLGSLYPVTTVLLARTLLGERLSGGQATGVAGTLLGVALIGLGG
jgi:drug/metabolite transporter (DMT)-like permease